MQISRAGFFLTLCLALVACGGGGGGGASSQSGIPFDYSGIEADLQTEDPVRVAASILRGADEISGFSATLDDDQIFAAAVNQPRHLWDLVLDAYRLQTAVAGYQGAVLPTISVGPEKDNCTYSGSVTVSANIADPDLFLSGILGVGDRFFADFSDCIDVPGETLDGGFDFRILSFAGNYNDPEYDVGLAFDLDRFRYTEPGDSILYDGSINASLTRIGGPEVTLITGGSLVYQSGGVTYAESDLRQMYTVDGQSFWLTASGVMESTLVTGELRYAVVMPLTGIVGNPPSAGEVQILGGNGSSMYITALPGEIVQLQVDGDGINGYETTLDVTWDQLNAAISD